MLVGQTQVLKVGILEVQQPISLGHPLILQVQLIQHQMLSQHHQQHQHRHIIL